MSVFPPFSIQKDPMPLTPKEKKLLVIFFVAFVLINIIVYVASQNRNKLTWFAQSKKTSASKVNPTPTPRPLICKGAYIFSVSGGNGKDPKILQGKLEQCDPQKGDKQKMEVTFTAQTPIVDAKVRLLTDHQAVEYPLTKVNGTETQGTWTANWTMDDTYLYRYLVQIEGKTTNDSNMTQLTFR